MRRIILGVLLATLLVSVFAGTAVAEELFAGEQEIPISGLVRNDEERASIRSALASVPGVAEVRGQSSIILAFAPGESVTLSSLSHALAAAGGPWKIDLNRLSIGMQSVVEIEFRDVIPEDATDSVVAALKGQARVARAVRFGPRRFRIQTNAGGFMNVTGSVVVPVGRALGNLPMPPSVDRYISEITWLRPRPRPAAPPSDSPAVSAAS